jgi:hypothetical protein
MNPRLLMTALMGVVGFTRAPAPRENADPEAITAPPDDPKPTTTVVHSGSIGHRFVYDEVTPWPSQATVTQVLRDKKRTQRELVFAALGPAKTGKTRRRRAKAARRQAREEGNQS